jgi:ABC-type multidrug transport system fused ATPase/permease subunit
LTNEFPEIFSFNKCVILPILPKAYFDQHPTGETLSKLTYDVEQIANAASTIWKEFITFLILCIVDFD